MINNITMIYEGVYALNELKKFYNINAKIGELKKNGYKILTVARKKYVDQKNAERMIAEFCEKFEFARYDEYLKEWMAPEIHEQSVMEIVDSEIWADDEHEYNRIAYVYCALDGDEFRAEEIGEEFIVIEEQAEDDGVEDFEPEDWEFDETIDFDVPAVKPEETAETQAEEQNDEDIVGDDIDIASFEDDEFEVELAALGAELDDIINDIVTKEQLEDVEVEEIVTDTQYVLNNYEYEHPVWEAIGSVKVMATYERKINEEVEIELIEVEAQLMTAIRNKDWRRATKVIIVAAAEWFNTMRAVKKNDLNYAAETFATILKECGYNKVAETRICETVCEELDNICVKSNAKDKAYNMMAMARRILGCKH